MITDKTLMTVFIEKIDDSSLRISFPRIHPLTKKFIEDYGEVKIDGATIKPNGSLEVAWRENSIMEIAGLNNEVPMPVVLVFGSSDEAELFKKKIFHITYRISEIVRLKEFPAYLRISPMESILASK